MDNATKERLLQLRIVDRKSYKEIADELGLSLNTVKSYCHRHDLGDERIKGPKTSRNEEIKLRPPKEPRPTIGFCKDCGTAFMQPKRGNLRKYCSSLCAHRQHLYNPRTYTLKFCEVCGKPIKQIDSAKPRKYCSNECYITGRYYMVNGERVTKSRCKTCGKEIIKPGHKVMQYCCQQCYWDSLKGV
ncbi:MAG: sigma-70 family RNA polymerase sigma factor [Lachnospiraceae bacterium]|nr:sigma-70 family RNA polymerase sigma factor [Candidatus Colinaster scatohippi]